MIILHPNPLGALQQFLNGSKEIIPLPVGVNQIFASSTPPGLASVNVRSDWTKPVPGNHQSLIPAKGGVEEVIEIVDVVEGSKKDPVKFLFFH